VEEGIRGLEYVCASTVVGRLLADIVAAIRADNLTVDEVLRVQLSVGVGVCASSLLASLTALRTGFANHQSADVQVLDILQPETRALIQRILAESGGTRSGGRRSTSCLVRACGMQALVRMQAYMLADIPAYQWCHGTTSPRDYCANIAIPAPSRPKLQLMRIRRRLCDWHDSEWRAPLTPI
jgi:hypothetical protein